MAAYPGRKAVAQALFDLAKTAADGVTPLVTSGRRLRLLQSVGTEEMPALFMGQKPETQERGAIGLPAKRTMHFELWIYTADPQDDTVVPADQLDDFMDAIETALRPDPTSGACTLGGLVRSARIDGSVEYFENATNDGKSALTVPVSVLMP